MDLKEKRIHGEEGLPVSMYAQTPGSLRYHMNCHWHPEHEIIYVQKGRMELRLGLGEEFLLLSRGDVAFVPGGTLHSAVPFDCDYVCFVLDPLRMLPAEDSCMKILQRIGEGRYQVERLVSREHPEFSSLCEVLWQTMTAREEGFAFFVKGYILQFFGYLIQYHLYQKQELPLTGEEKSVGHMKRVLDHIRKNYSHEISLGELASLSHMSPNYFCRYFKRMTGQTPIEYLITYRLEAACYALRNTDLTVTDIAFACGFNDVSHFVKSFRRAYGTPPKSYRMGLWEETKAE